MKELVAKIYHYMRSEAFLFVYRLKIRKSDIVLLDTPLHGNLGDQAIAIAEIQILKENFPNKTVLEVPADYLDRFETKFAKITPLTKLILVHGGGFLGDLWPNEEYRFRKIVDAFRNHKLIVFPQTISFSSYKKNQFFEDSRKAYINGKKMHICLREQKSMDIMKKYFPEINILKVPDSVLMMKMKCNNEIKKNAILCFRADHEKIVSDVNVNFIKKTIEERFRKDEIYELDTVISHKIKIKSRKTHVKNLLTEFAKAKIVITDRLHGMVFAAITNTPCIALGNVNGKVEGVYEWLKCNNYIYYLEDLNSFKEMYESIDLDRNYIYNNAFIKKEYEKLIMLINEKIN